MSDKTYQAALQVAIEELAEERNRLREALNEIQDAFTFLPHLHGAISTTTIDDLRCEMHRVIDDVGAAIIRSGAPLHLRVAS